MFSLLHICLEKKIHIFSFCEHQWLRLTNGTRARCVSPLFSKPGLFSVSGSVGKCLKNKWSTSSSTANKRYEILLLENCLPNSINWLWFSSNIDTSLKGKHSYTVFKIDLGHAKLVWKILSQLRCFLWLIKISFCFHAHSQKALIGVDMPVWLCWITEGGCKATQRSAGLEAAAGDYSKPQQACEFHRCIQQLVLLCQWCTVLLLALLWLHYMTHKTVLYLTWD